MPENLRSPGQRRNPPHNQIWVRGQVHHMTEYEHPTTQPNMGKVTVLDSQLHSDVPGGNFANGKHLLVQC